MQIKSPCIITPRLMPGVKIGDSFLSIEYAGATPDSRLPKYGPIPRASWDNRQAYNIYLDTPQGEHVIDDIQSGIGGGKLAGGAKVLP